MAVQLKTRSAKKAPAAKETSESIESQTEAFLKAGGKIQYIDQGVSGQQQFQGHKKSSDAAKSKS
ncbi:MAG TPA: hypothetical protein VIM96_01305 [Pseudomonadales bacterium]|jgi:hypothetical protein